MESLKLGVSKDNTDASYYGSVKSFRPEDASIRQ